MRFRFKSEIQNPQKDKPFSSSDRFGSLVLAPENVGQLIDGFKRGKRKAPPERSVLRLSRKGITAEKVRTPKKRKTVASTEKPYDCYAPFRIQRATGN